MKIASGEVATAVVADGLYLVFHRYRRERGWSASGLSSIVLLGEVQQPALGEWIGVAGDLTDARRLLLEIIFVHEINPRFYAKCNILGFQFEFF
jgi:hypothetical protein